MKLMRYSAVRLGTMLMYAASFVILPLPTVGSLAVVVLPVDPDSGAGQSEDDQACSCPMCHAVNGHMQHCACCAGKTCTCKMSSKDGEAIILLTLQSAVLYKPGAPRITPASLHLLSLNPSFDLELCLPVPTPPPRA